MTTEQAWLVAAGAVALAAVLVAAVAWRSAHRALVRVEELSARLEQQESTAPVDERRTTAAPADAAPYVITGLDPDEHGRPPGVPPVAPPVAERIDGRLFTDIVARETVVRAASWSHGIRRALSPESRNRIAFQVRQQTKQQRRDRRTEVREALREYRARHRSAGPTDVPADAPGSHRAGAGDAA